MMDELYDNKKDYRDDINQRSLHYSFFMFLDQ